MRSRVVAVVAFLITSFAAAEQPTRSSAVANPAIDMPGHLRIAEEAAAHRESHRLSEEAFVRMSLDPGTVILDARSAKMYDKLHVKGAVNVPFPDIAAQSLRTTIPDRSTRILIYCNNNFLGPEAVWPYKVAPAALNLSTYIALYTYGYRNVYELAPLLDVRASKLSFEGTEVDSVLR
jgi:phage shock protein E